MNFTKLLPRKIQSNNPCQVLLREGLRCGFKGRHQIKITDLYDRDLFIYICKDHLTKSESFILYPPMKKKKKNAL